MGAKAHAGTGDANLGVDFIRCSEKSNLRSAGGIVRIPYCCRNCDRLIGTDKPGRDLQLQSHLANKRAGDQTEVAGHFRIIIFLDAVIHRGKGLPNGGNSADGVVDGNFVPIDTATTYFYLPQADVIGIHLDFAAVENPIVGRHHADFYPKGAGDYILIPGGRGNSDFRGHVHHGMNKNSPGGFVTVVIANDYEIFRRFRLVEKNDGTFAFFENIRIRTDGTI
ncbi:MAG: hypothetical protein ACD_75C01367G0002 [uncultured bacterium]|nr:MAG: hypothetical protein ACD_75C01367G0002 [uncultured bacterium]